MLTAGITIRSASLSDIPEIVRQRREMYEDMGDTDSFALATMQSLSAPYLEKALTDDSLHAWLACDGERPVAGASVIITPWPPHPYDLECRRATILNVYTNREYRRRGIARELTRAVIEWCRHEGLVRVTLHASHDGRHLYEALGFEPSNEMWLKLR